MSYKNMFDAPGDGSQDENTLYSLSGEFLEAARTLQSVPPTKTKYSHVIYYLLGHSAELALKAFLFKRGHTLEQLMKIGHDLGKLISVAAEHNLKSTKDTIQLKELSKLYKTKQYEYRKNSGVNLPDLQCLTEEIENIHTAVFDALF
ncbi:MAG: hypothetical protein COA41_12730 [Sphingopyxis sp.]|jgi:HEPN domain-containing protein|nr:MAG: hypothetical protein COA41_12730 [Sphingopyxis sp.]